MPFLNETLFREIAFGKEVRSWESEEFGIRGVWTDQRSLNRSDAWVVSNTSVNTGQVFCKSNIEGGHALVSWARSWMTWCWVLFSSWKLWQPCDQDMQRGWQREKVWRVLCCLEETSVYLLNCRSMQKKGSQEQYRLDEQKTRLASGNKNRKESASSGNCSRLSIKVCCCDKMLCSQVPVQVSWLRNLQE